MSFGGSETGGCVEVQFTIRNARSEDAARVREIVFSVLSEYGLEPDPGGTDADLDDLEANYAKRSGAFRIAESPQGSVIGCAGLYRLTAEEAELRKMYLLPVARGRGLGKRLLTDLLEEARRLGYRRVVLETASVLTEAIGLYQGAGFRPASRGHLSARCDQGWALRLFPEQDDRRTRRRADGE